MPKELFRLLLVTVILMFLLLQIPHIVTYFMTGNYYENTMKPKEK